MLRNRSITAKPFENWMCIIFYEKKNAKWVHFAFLLANSVWNHNTQGIGVMTKILKHPQNRHIKYSVLRHIKAICSVNIQSSYKIQSVEFIFHVSWPFCHTFASSFFTWPIETNILKLMFTGIINYILLDGVYEKSWLINNHNY